MNFKDNLGTSEEGTTEQEAPSQRQFDYEELLRAVGDPELKEISELPIFQRTFLLHTGEGGKFSVDFRDIILGGGLLADNISTMGLDQVLLKSPALEVLLISASDQMNDLRARIEVDLDEWTAVANADSEEKIRKERKDQKLMGERKDIGAITAQQIKDRVIIENPKEYRDYKMLLNDVVGELKYLNELLETIRFKAIRAMNILNRRSA